MRCSPEFRQRVAKQADLARRKTGKGYTGQLTFTYGEVMWILADLQKLANIEAKETLKNGADSGVNGIPPTAESDTSA